MASCALAAVALLGAWAGPSSAAVVADPPPPVPIALVRVSSARGDAKVEQLVSAALRDTGRFKVVRNAEDAAVFGKLEITRTHGEAHLQLTVVERGGGVVAVARQFVGRGTGMAIAAEALAVRLVAAFDEARRKAAAGAAGPPRAGEPPPAANAPGAARPERSAEAPRGERTAEAPRGDRTAEAPRRERAEARLGPPPAGSPRTGKDGEASLREEPKPPPENRLDFILGVELATGRWSANPADLIAGSPTYDMNGYAPAFTAGLDQGWRSGVALHGGWGFLGYAAFEMAVQLSRWGGGKATLIGARFSGYPLRALWKASPVEGGLELGFGHTFIANGFYDMSGPYLTLGLKAEYPLHRLFGVVAHYRFYKPLLGTFYVDHRNDRSESVSFSPSWNTFGIGLSFRPAISW